MRRSRFSLRSLLGLAMLVAVAGFWRDLPRQNAKRFAMLVNAGQYDKAEVMFGERVGLAGKPIIFGDFQVSLDSQTFGDWVRGRYPMTISAKIPGGDVYVLGADATATAVVRAKAWSVTSAPSASP